jgi:NADPH2:quinone reductase
VILDVVGGPLFEACLQSLAQRGRQVSIASAGNPLVTFNLVDFYHKEACLMGLDTIKLSLGESAEILRGLLPGFKKGTFSAPPVKMVPLDEAIAAYRATFEGSSREKYVIHFGSKSSA